MNNLKNESLILGQYLNQKTLMKELHIGFNTLKDLHDQGLQPIIIGRQRLYDVEELKQVLTTLKLN
ncbi:hypothetical protein ACOJB1_07590 [Enterococcus innesii]|uniref:hypothetical protein n=1 Tax=Enterococcus innesii TaxID=2839759 RepID=UPI003B5B38B5